MASQTWTAAPGSAAGDNEQTPDSVIGKVRAIVDSVEIGGPQTLSQLARSTGLPKTTVRRLALELCEWGMLAQDEGVIMLGPRVSELASASSLPSRMRDLVRPYAIHFYSLFHVPVALVAPDGNDIVMVDLIRGASDPEAVAQAGTRIPMHVTAAGWAILAFGTTGQLQRIVSTDSSRTGGVTVSPYELSVTLHGIRRTGVAVIRTGPELGVRSFAVPVLDGRGLPIGALCVPLDSTEPPQDQAVALRQIAKAIERRLAMSASSAPPR